MNNIRNKKFFKNIKKSKQNESKEKTGIRHGRPRRLADSARRSSSSPFASHVVAPLLCTAEWSSSSLSSSCSCQPATMCYRAKPHSYHGP